jgi:hypothetical protein
MVFFRFDTGSGPIILRSKNKIVAGKWYSVEITRKLREGELKISGEPPIIGSSPGSTRGLNIRYQIKKFIHTLITSLSFSTFLVYNLFNFGLRLKKFESDFCIKCQIYIRKVMIVFGISSSELLSTLEASIGTSTRWPLGLEWMVDSVVASVTSSLEPA